MAYHTGHKPAVSAIGAGQDIVDTFFCAVYNGPQRTAEYIQDAHAHAFASLSDTFPGCQAAGSFHNDHAVCHFLHASVCRGTKQEDNHRYTGGRNTGRSSFSVSGPSA